MCQKPLKQPDFSITKKQSHFCNCLKFNYLTCDPVGIRTQDPQLRRLLLYPAELPDRSVSGAVGTGICIHSCSMPYRLPFLRKKRLQRYYLFWIDKTKNCQYRSMSDYPSKIHGLRKSLQKIRVSLNPSLWKIRVCRKYWLTGYPSGVKS